MSSANEQPVGETNRCTIDQANEDRQVPIHVHEVNLTDQQVKSNDPQPPYNTQSNNQGGNS